MKRARIILFVVLAAWALPSVWITADATPYVLVGIYEREIGHFLRGGPPVY